MRRTLLGGLTAVVVLAFAPMARGQVVQYRDRTSKDGKPKAISGTIKADTVAGLTLKPLAGAELQIAAPDILDVTFDLGGKNLPFQQAQSAERKSLSAGITAFTALIAQLDPRSAESRQLQYHVAMLRALLADQSADRPAEEHQARMAEAIAALKKFKTDHPNCWQLTSCVRQLANLQLDSGDAKAALATLEELAGNPNLPRENQEDVQMLAIDLLLRAKDYKTADQRVEALMQRLPAGSPNRARLTLIQTGCQALRDPTKLPQVAAQLQAIVEDKSKEPYLKALACNVLGDCYQAAGQKREALWSYLWVDVIYNQDKQEHVKALDRLVRLFKELKDEDRAKEFEDRLRRLR